MRKRKLSRMLSIIIPAYNQERTIAKNIESIKKVLSMTNFPYEIIVVVDGMLDNTYKNAKKKESKHVKVYGYQQNKGKGYAVRYGMKKSLGDVIAFIDAGQDLNPLGIRMLLAHFDWYDADIIVGSKWHPVSKVQYPWWRRILSIGYGILVKLLFQVRISDTQLGLKLYRREVIRKILPKLTVDKFAMDIEIIALANKLGFRRIYEAPVELYWNNLDSSISKNLIKSIIETFWDTIVVFYRLKFTRYYDEK